MVEDRIARWLTELIYLKEPKYTIYIIFCSSRKKVGNKEVFATLPNFIQFVDQFSMQHMAILDRWLVKRFNKKVVKVLEDLV